jgi:hypothetical protein
LVIQVKDGVGDKALFIIFIFAKRMQDVFQKQFLIATEKLDLNMSLLSILADHI